jgi:hypothetical protein
MPRLGAMRCGLSVVVGGKGGSKGQKENVCSYDWRQSVGMAAYWDNQS